MTSNARIYQLFNEMADLLELSEANPFKVRAYRRAAQTVDGLSEDVADRAEQGTLEEIPGIGRDLALKIGEFLAGGTIAELEELRASVPPVLVRLIRIPGLGPKNALRLHHELGLSSLEELEQACRHDRVAALKGFGAKSQQNLLEGIDFLRRASERRLLGEALPVAEAIVAALEDVPGVVRVSPAGSLRRMKETVKDIDLVAAAADPGPVMAAFTGHPLAVRVLAHGNTRSSIRTADDLQVDLRVVSPEVFGAALMHFTGSREHNIRLRERAVPAGLKINEYGVFDVSGLSAEQVKDPRAGRRLGSETEEDCFEALGLPWIAPELREDSGEIQAALEGSLPPLLEPGQIRGDLHTHTDASDGRQTLTELIEAARRRGYAYIGVTDHSRSLKLAGGLDLDRMRWQIDRVREADARQRDIRVLVGSEVDILRDGTLDYPDELLAELDIVIGSIHTSFRLDRPTQTARLITAMQNPHLFAIGHPTGRLLGEREAYPLDLEAVIAEAARTGTALEINANPSRLDLNDKNARAARRAGVEILISTDAHRTEQLDFMGFGVRVARRAWLGPGDIVNTLPERELRQALHRKRDGKGSGKAGRGRT
jgi:DNA polymerase (family 10)